MSMQQDLFLGFDENRRDNIYKSQSPRFWLLEFDFNLR
jgi:hypothetical protein